MSMTELPSQTQLTTCGKAWGLRRLADAKGFFAMVAIDQRPPIEQLIARARGIERAQVTFADQVLAKRWLARALAPHASAMLVDPNYGYSASVDLLRPERGLLLTLEDHRFAETKGGRKSHCIDGWSVGQIRRLGADAVKLLAWYRPDATADVLEHQHRLVREVGAACREHDIAFIFELLTYPFPSGPGSLRDYVEDPAKRPQLVVDSVRAFAAPEYGVDLFKLESPLPAPELPDPDDAQAASAQPWFDALGQACGDTPWVMLSAGASMQGFERALRFALRAGASGFLAGRAVWWDALAAFPDEVAVATALQRDAVPYLKRLHELTQRQGRPCRPTLDASGIAVEGDFVRARRR
jgi:tagatose 1,6-diphosphate aldolase